MFLDVFIPLIVNFLIYDTLYSSLINCLMITISSFLKIIFYNNYVFHKILEITTLSSILFYTIDTFKILHNGKLNIFVLHHICTCQLLLSKYIFNYDIYISYILLFIIELSSVFYNLYYHKFIDRKIHIPVYVSLRIISNIILIYFIIHENKYTYLTELILDLTSYFLLFIFNIGGILKSLYSLKH